MKLQRLADVADFINGKAFKPNDWKTSGLPIIRIQNLTGTSDVYNYFDGEIENKYLVKKGDILISWSASLGIYEWQSNGVLNQHIFKVNLKKVVEKKYFYYAVMTRIREMEKQVHGSTMKHITKDKFDNIEIPVPDLKIQKQIAQLLEEADIARQKRKAANTLTDQFLQSTFLSMFGDPVRNEKKWESVDLKDMVDFENGDRSSNYPSGDHIVDSGIVFINSANIIDFRFNTTNCNFISEEKYFSLRSGKCKRGDILFTLRGNGLGKCCVFNGPFDEGFVNAQLVIIKCSTELNNQFLVEQLRKPTMFKNIWNFQSGSAQPQLSVEQLKKLRIIVPPRPLQQKFASIVADTEQLRQKQKQSEIELENLFQALLQKYFG